MDTARLQLKKEDAVHCLCMGENEWNHDLQEGASAMMKKSCGALLTGSTVPPRSTFLVNG